MSQTFGSRALKRHTTEAQGLRPCALHCCSAGPIWVHGSALWLTSWSLVHHHLFSALQHRRPLCEGHRCAGAVPVMVVACQCPSYPGHADICWSTVINARLSANSDASITLFEFRSTFTTQSDRRAEPLRPTVAQSHACFQILI